MLDYSELYALLRISGAGTCAADCHGFMCGQICVNEFPERPIWEEYLDLQVDDEMIIDETCRDMVDLATETRHLFLSPEFEFQLLLPGDETPLDERVDALGEWCHGFLNGFAIGQGTNRILDDEYSRELIENFTRICRVEAGRETGEDDERALVELVEYVRIGAIYIFDQLQTGIDGGDSDGPEIYH